LLATSIDHSAECQDWSQWRGPGRDGVVSAANAPSAWPERLEKRWHVEAGEGYSSPVQSENRIFLHVRRDPQETVMAVDRITGKLIWQSSYSAPFNKQSDAAKMMKGPHATPLVSDGKLFTIGASAILSCYKAADGQVLWRKDFSKTVDSSKLFCGTSASPLMAGGLLIVQTGSDIHGGKVTALNPETGVEVWS